MTDNKTNAGTIEISPDVIASIASVAATEVDGVAGFSSGIVDSITGKIGRKNLTKGIKVSQSEEELIIDIYVIVEHGVEINKVSSKVQEAVLSAVEKATGLKCSQVNMHIQGILAPVKDDNE